MGDPRLRQQANPVPLSELAHAAQVAAAMQQLMSERNGVGIAAPQIGVGLALMIIASRPSERYPDAPNMDPLLLINPTLSWQSESLETLWEGCLSVPGLRGRVTRPHGVAVDYMDLNGDKHRVELEGFPARIFLHEYDHLIGKTFLDRVASSEDLVTEKVYFEQICTA